jgi:hypothetical protein
MMNTGEIESGDTGSVLGNTVKVEFASFGNRSTEGKVDTGATTSSLHADKITINRERQTVTFHSEALSDNLVTLPMHGVQEVHSADHGGDHRPIIQLDVTIDGTPIKSATFNLNDRSNMDTKILIGQNILKAGNFKIDPNRDEPRTPEAAQHAPGLRNEAAILQALEVLAENNLTLKDLLVYLQTAAVNRIE